MEPLTDKDILKLHRDKFGVEPIITGAERFNKTPLAERILDAIADGRAYVEAEVAEGVEI